MMGLGEVVRVYWISNGLYIHSNLLHDGMSGWVCPKVVICCFDYHLYG